MSWDVSYILIYYRPKRRHIAVHCLKKNSIFLNTPLSHSLIAFIFPQNNGAQQLASEATIFVVLEDVNDEIPLFSEREQERVLEGEPVGTVVTRTSAMDRDGTFPNNAVYYYIKKDSEGERFFF